MSKQIDYVADIMDKWYKAMENENVGVQPKCATMLGTVLSGYNIILNTSERDIWKEYLDVKGGDFSDWWKGLTKAEKSEWTKRKEEARDLYDSRFNKQLLKG